MKLHSKEKDSQLRPLGSLGPPCHPEPQAPNQYQTHQNQCRPSHQNGGDTTCLSLWCDFLCGWSHGYRFVQDRFCSTTKKWEELPCGKFKPKLVQKSFLRKSQDLHLDAVPITYAQRSLRKRGSHTQALRFGAAQPFWTLSQRCCSNKKHTRTKATSKMDQTTWLS